jgi:hypothetical protein
LYSMCYKYQNHAQDIKTFNTHMTFTDNFIFFRLDGRRIQINKTVFL